MGILDEDVRRVREATDLVALAGEHLALRRVGRRFVGLCPFHTENTPSFSINPELGVFHCFGCQRSGDAITFVRDVEHLDFPDAVERLAGRAGITLRYDEASVSQDRKRRDRLAEAVGAAVDFYHRVLIESPEAGGARRYLRSRGFEGDAVRRFSLGYAPESYDTLSRSLQAAKFSRDDITTAGLAFVNRANKLQDQFRGRLMFPIYDARGEPAGFGGRALGDEDARVGPKYKNSPETPLYQKSRLLYGLNWAKGEIVAHGEVVICEGYTDVMAFALAGVPYAVATCGTALADDHFQILKNLARRVTLAYDADAAGQAAAERCYQWEQRFEVEFQVADLPSGRDPADVWRDDPAVLVKAVEGAEPFLQFRLERLLQGADLDTFERRAHAAERAAAIVAEHPSELVRDQYVMSLVDRLGIDADRLRSAVASGNAPGATTRPRRDDNEPGSRAQPRASRIVDRREVDALRWAIHAPELVADWLHEGLFADPIAREAFDALATSSTFLEAVDSTHGPARVLLERLGVEEPLSDDEPETLEARLVINTVEPAAQRLLSQQLRDGDERSSAVKALLDTVVESRFTGAWASGKDAARQLVAWTVSIQADAEHDADEPDEHDEHNDDHAQREQGT